MKAEHRKELHTNLLADRMGRLVQGMKSGQSSTSTIMWVLTILAAGTFLAWYFAGGASQSHSAVWARLDGDTNPRDLSEIAQQNPGTIAERVARFKRAEVMLEEGLATLFPPAYRPPVEKTAQHTQALADIEDARKAYATLALECTDDSIFERKALLGSARTEECLAGVPRADDTSAKRGDLNRALELYRRYLEIDKPGELTGRSLTENLQQLDDKAKKGAALSAREAWWRTIARHVQDLETKDENGSNAAEALYMELNRIAATESATPR